jgi:hypothetical protein
MRGANNAKGSVSSARKKFAVLIGDLFANQLADISPHLFTGL